MRLAQNTLRRTLRRAFRRSEFAAQSFDIPTFLCPVLLSYNPTRFNPFKRHRSLPLKASQRRCLHMADSTLLAPELSPLKLELPILCTGCGAYAQTYDQEKPGFYTLNRKSVKDFLQGNDISGGSRKKEEHDIVLKALQNADSKLVESLGLETALETTSNTPTSTTSSSTEHKIATNL